MAYPTFEQTKNLFLNADPFERKLADLVYPKKTERLEGDINFDNMFVDVDILNYIEEINYVANIIDYYC